MNFAEWLAANNYDGQALSDSQRRHLEAAWKADTNPNPPPAPDTPPPLASDGGFSQKIAAIEQENQRITYIREATVAACERQRGNPDKVKQLRQLGEAAIADQKTDQRAFDLALLRADRALGPMVLTPPSQQQMNEGLLEAAICMSHRLPEVEKKFAPETLQAAHTRFRRGIGLQELLALAAERNNGYRGSCRDIQALCRAAFTQHSEGDYYGFRAEGVSSTISVPGILSNVANKFLASSFLYTEQAWRQIARIRPANDFKQMSTYRLTGANKFEKVPPAGELHHGTLSELTYTNQVETYGKILGLDRRDIINDDLNAFSGAVQELGRGAGDSLNEIFWGVWLADTAFFNTDKSKANYDDGATDSVLSLAGLNNAETMFRLQTKPDGTPLGILPAILLTPASLYNTGLQLMGSQGLVVGTTPASGPQQNVFFGRYRTVSSVYLDAASTTAWYLLADPNNVAAIEVAFLNGADTPTVETNQFDFDRLGISFRAFFDFGVGLQEYRAAVKLKGSA